MLLSSQEVLEIKTNVRKYPDPMPWDPVDSVRKLLAHVEDLEISITMLRRQINELTIRSASK